MFFYNISCEIQHVFVKSTKRKIERKQRRTKNFLFQIRKLVSVMALLGLNWLSYQGISRDKFLHDVYIG